MTRPDIETLRLRADGAFPNNKQLPVLIYRGVLDIDSQSASDVEQKLKSNGWGGTWRNGVFPFHHYHSNTHEVLVCCAGEAEVQFGGPSGPVPAVIAGDVVILPAGTAHKKISASDGFLVVGAYPAGHEKYDLIKEEPGEKSAAERRIANVPVPETDPIFGSDGPLQDHWRDPKDP